MLTLRYLKKKIKHFNNWLFFFLKYCPDGKRYCTVVAEPFVGKYVLENSIFSTQNRLHLYLFIRCVLCLEPCDPECKKHYIVQDTLCPEWQCFPIKEGNTDFWLFGVAITVTVIASFFTWWFFARIKRWCTRNLHQRNPGVDRGVIVDAVNGGGRIPTAPPEVQQQLVIDLNEGNQPIIT